MENMCCHRVFHRTNTCSPTRCPIGLLINEVDWIKFHIKSCDNKIYLLIIYASSFLRCSSITHIGIQCNSSKATNALSKSILRQLKLQDNKRTRLSSFNDDYEGSQRYHLWLFRQIQSHSCHESKGIPSPDQVRHQLVVISLSNVSITTYSWS